ncbi:ankyrin repeat domain-containing protein [Sansalvadorimonas verongulae]|uniref:ankyrin repeat domain-containing protein n=1 Tax=Sansalvadorimonas verongulae TaxID=2172824 RepID=UPI0012BC5463|nr:ankyrin repeat domain-containing protein [Sansalvadorimonas verongulae]MTI12950.1 ankyrin repeat domain-containing protein [Sansalvadorimonas verongulae]
MLRIYKRQRFLYVGFFLSILCLSMPVPASPRAGEHPFIAACREGDIDKVQEYIAQEGFNLNDTLSAGLFRFKTYGLHVAAENNHIESATTLIEHGASLNTESCVPLYQASHGGHYKMVKLLLSYGAMPDLKLSYFFWKETPLFAAQLQRVFRFHRLRDFNQTVALLRHITTHKADTESTPLLRTLTPPTPK